ncbi:MAG TPA: TonB-dependent receptor [Petrimonas sp.]|nr:TonB-dependent receptor [Petrimonas sp.]
MINNYLNQMSLLKKMTFIIFFLLCLPLGILGQGLTVRGKVVSLDNQPLPGVTIMVKGTSIGTTSDIEGNYVLSNISEKATLVFSFVGMHTFEIVVGNQRVINVVMEEESIGLEEVIAVGYGVQKKVNLTGAVEVVSAKKLENRALTSVGEGLQGVIPNLNVTLYSGDPSENPALNIRGFTSINGGSPLILIDGMPADINAISPKDVESITVLKDASASSIYGARGAFGVILVQTKKGVEGDLKVNFSYELAALQPIWKMDKVIKDPYEYVTLMNKANIRAFGVPLYRDDYVANTKKWSENPTDKNAWGVTNGILEYYGSTWDKYHDIVLKPFSLKHDFALNVSGGTQKLKYYSSISYLNENGIFKIGDDKFERYNFLLNTNLKVNEWLSLDTKISYNVKVSDKPIQKWGNYDINSLSNRSPIEPIYFPSTNLFTPPDPNRDYSKYEGMFMGDTWIGRTSAGGRDRFQNHEFDLGQGITLTPLERWTFKGEFFYKLLHDRSDQFVLNHPFVLSNDLNEKEETMIGFGLNNNDYIDSYFSSNQYFVVNAVSEYEFDEATNPNYFKGMIGFNQEWGFNNSIKGTAQDFISNRIIDINATMGGRDVIGGRNHVALRGAFTRLNYIYNNRYLFEFSGRYDGTSRFPKNNRFGFFPSASVGWRISEESVMEGLSFLSNLKLRLSYGSLGNQSVGYYPYIATMPLNVPYTHIELTPAYLMGGEYYHYISSPGLVSPSLTWETVNTKNIGLDFGLFQNAFSGTFDIYQRATKGMLMRGSYPEILGASAPFENAADLVTKGWELTLAFNKRVNKDLLYNASLVLSDWKSEITKYSNPTNSLSTYYVGQQLGEIWGYETQGIFQTEDEIKNAAVQSNLGANWKPGDIRYKDLNGDGKINPGKNTLDDPGDRKVIGNNNPRYSFGINFDATYKALSINCFFQGVGKRDHFPVASTYVWFWPYADAHIERYFITESWSEDNRDAYFYAASTDVSNKNRQVQTRYLQDASYIRLKNITLSYDASRVFSKSTGIQGLGINLFVNMQNIWEYSKIHKPLDPEYIFKGIVPYPLQRTYNLGIRVSY